MKKPFAFLIDLLIDIIVIAIVVVLVFSVGYLFTERWPSWRLLIDIIGTVLVLDFLMFRLRKYLTRNGR